MYIVDGQMQVCFEKCFLAVEAAHFLDRGDEANVRSYLDVVLPLEVHGVGVVYPEEVGVFLHDRDGVVLRKVLHLRWDRDGPVSAEEGRTELLGHNPPG